MLMLTAADERTLFWPVMAGFAAMIIVCLIGAWLQGRRERDARPLELAPRAPQEPRSHVVTGPTLDHNPDTVYDWSAHDTWPAR